MRMMPGTRCAVCLPTESAAEYFEGVPLCRPHLRVAAMKRLGLTEADLAGADPTQPQEQPAQDGAGRG